MYGYLAKTHILLDSLYIVGMFLVSQVQEHKDRPNKETFMNGRFL